MSKIIIWFFVLMISYILFKKAAGTMNPGKINPISGAYYIILLQTILGAVFTSFGFTEHYTYARLINEVYYSKMGIIFSIILIMLLPIMIILISKILKFKPQSVYEQYLQRETDDVEFNLYFPLICFASLICLFFLIVLLIDIGYVPLIKLFTSNDMFDFGLERQRIANLNIFNNGYFKSIFVLYAIPTLSFIAFSFMITTKEKRWYILFFILFFASIIVKTYNFQKAPLVFYLFVFYLIYIFHKGGLSFKYVFMMISVSITFLLIFYGALAHEVVIDLYNGIIGRTVFTQFGTLCMHFEVFTEYIDFLHGRSLSPSILSIMGMDASSHVRSGRVVMEMYNPLGVYEGAAGVSNTIFIGEAYANWGIIGIIFSIVWISLILTICFICFMKLKKNPVTVAYFAILTQQLVITLQGGFADYIYNATSVFNILGLIVLYYLPNIFNYISSRLKQ